MAASEIPVPAGIPVWDPKAGWKGAKGHAGLARSGWDPGLGSQGRLEVVLAASPVIAGIPVWDPSLLLLAC